MSDSPIHSLTRREFGVLTLLSCAGCTGIGDSNGGGDGDGAAINGSEDDEPYDDTTDEGYGERGNTTRENEQGRRIPPDSELFDYAEDTVRECLKPEDLGGFWEYTNEDEAFVGYRMLGNHRYKTPRNVPDADSDSDHGVLYTPGIHREDWVLPFITDEPFLDGLDWEIQMQFGHDTYSGNVPTDELHEIDTGVYIGMMDLSPWADHMAHRFSSSEGLHSLFTEEGDLS